MKKVIRLAIILLGAWVFFNTKSFLIAIVAAILVCGAIFL